MRIVGNSCGGTSFWTHEKTAWYGTWITHRWGVPGRSFLVYVKFGFSNKFAKEKWGLVLRTWKLGKKIIDVSEIIVNRFNITRWAKSHTQVFHSPLTLCGSVWFSLHYIFLSLNRISHWKAIFNETCSCSPAWMVYEWGQLVSIVMESSL